jgi:3',5'-cyclic AMP phosphodiesterase CpdA
VSLLLHLSDLHLGNSLGEDVLSDYKLGAIPETERQSRVKLLENTLAGLATRLKASGETLDAVIISGDVTTRHRSEGFERLPELLAMLGEALPPPERIVVAPGNHDVDWDQPPAVKARYDAFIQGTRRHGYVTPLLDGVDYRDDGTPKANRRALLVGTDFLVAAVNSADMCGVKVKFEPEVEKELEVLLSGASAKLREAIKDTRTFDMPRINQRQLRALPPLIDSAASTNELVRIAVLHHHVLPVGEDEEEKAFESVSNLAELRTLLRTAKIDVVLHGHKHADQVEITHFRGDDDEAPERFAVVASCGTVGGQKTVGTEIAKLIQIQAEQPSLRRVSVTSVPAISASAKLPARLHVVYSGPTWRRDPHTQVRVVGGGTADEVQQRLLELAETRQGQPLRDVLCVVDDGATALRPPASYPWTSGDDVLPLAEWFDQTVAWWQDPERAEGKPFTHGQRLEDWGVFTRVNQIERIVSVLGAKPSSSRGIAVLVNPAADDVAEPGDEFPSFSLLHAWIESDALHLTAFFRKQEMRFWWAVNCAELSRIQQAIVAELRPEQQRLTAGAIRTYASAAVFSDRLPKVDVPYIDRLVWQDPTRLWTLAVAFVNPSLADRNVDLDELRRLMDDWRPQAELPPEDGAAVPVRGLAVLAEAIAVLAERFGNNAAQEAARLLRDVHERNLTYAEKRIGSTNQRKAYGLWRKDQLERLDRFAEMIKPSASRRPRARS